LALERGSVLAAILFHAASNSTGLVILALAPSIPRDPWPTAALALVLIVLTRG